MDRDLRKEQRDREERNERRSEERRQSADRERQERVQAAKDAVRFGIDKSR